MIWYGNNNKVLRTYKFMDSLFHLDNTLGYPAYDNNGSHRLDKRSLQYAPACLQVQQENKLTKYKWVYN